MGTTGLSGAGPGTVDLDDLVPDSWCQLFERLGLRGMIVSIASHCELRARDGSNLQFILDEAHSTLLNDSHSGKLQLALGNFFGVPIAATLTPGQVRRETPAMRTARLAEQRQAEAVISIEGDERREGNR